MNDNQEQLNNRFDLLSSEITKVYLEKTHHKKEEISNWMYHITELASNKIKIKCHEAINNLAKYSDTETYIDEFDNIKSEIIPNEKFKKEFYKYQNEYKQCSESLLKDRNDLINYDKTFKELNNSTYYACLTDCRTELINNKGDPEKERLCLRDCYNMSMFNFNSYYTYYTNIANDILVKEQ